MRPIESRLSVNYWIIVTTVISLFTEAARFRFGIDLKLFYLVVLLNSGLLIVFYKFAINAQHMAVLVGLASLGSIGVLLGTSTPSSFLFQISGISIISLYYYAFFRAFVASLEEIFHLYALASLYVALIGMAIALYEFLANGVFARLHSVMLEPAHFSMVVMPALYYFAERSIYRASGDWGKAALLFGAVLLSGSSVGLLGLAMVAFLLIKGKVARLIIAPAICIVGLGAAYQFDAFRLRVDDTSMALRTGDLSEVNLSTFALVKNLYVAVESFKHNPVMGGGLGSHEVSHEKYVRDIQGVEALSAYVELNAKDANSLAIRVMSELGLVGLLGLALFIWKFHVRGDGVANAILCYFFLKLLREGHYFSPEMYFFVLAYYFNSCVKRRAWARSASQRRPEGLVSSSAGG